MSSRPGRLSEIDKKAQDPLTRNYQTNQRNSVSTGTVPAVNAVRHSPKRPIENDANGTNGDKGQTIKVKRQKKTNEGLNDTTDLQINTHSHTNSLTSENASKDSSNLETKSESQSDFLAPKKRPCAFCHSFNQTEGSGPLVAFSQGKEVVGNVANFSKVTHVHEKCIQWAPRIYYNKDGKIQNLESEVVRANKLKCSSCGKKGAGLGCFMDTCQRTYHVPCAYIISECRWSDNYLLLCPKHAHHNFPTELNSEEAVKQDTEKRKSTKLNPCTVQLDAGKKLVFCGSDLSSEEKCTLVEFAKSNGAKVSKYWTPNITHVIAATDSNAACTRTYKVLMAILHGKWILTLEWVKACVEAGSLVNEEPYEVHLDTHGCCGGPKAGRLRVINNAPRLFDKLEFYLIGDFVQAYKTDLINLIRTAGGTVIETKDQLLSSSNVKNEDVVKRESLVVYNADVSDHSEFDDEDSIRFQRLAVAEDIARESRSRVIEHIWILESIASCSLRPFTSRV